MRAIVAGLALALFAPIALAQEVTITASDTTQSVLAAQKGKRVTVIGALSGREFFDTVVPLDAVEAVLIRTKQ